MLTVGVSGGTASGKTTIVNQLVKAYSQDKIVVISQDSYYKSTDNLSPSERCNINFDHPNAIDFDLLIQHLETLKEGRSINQPIYSFKKHNREEETIKVNSEKVIVVEGILIFSNERLFDLLDVKIFVDEDADIRLKRRLQRDVKERGRDIEEVMDRYQVTIKPMHEQFVEPNKSKADIVITNGTDIGMAVEIIANIIEKKA